MSVHWFLVCPSVGLPFIQSNPPDNGVSQKPIHRPIQTFHLSKKGHWNVFSGHPIPLKKKTHQIWGCVLLLVNCLSVCLSVSFSKILWINQVSQKNVPPSQKKQKKLFFFQKKDTGMLLGTPYTFAKKKTHQIQGCIRSLVHCSSVCWSACHSIKSSRYVGCPKNVPLCHKNFSLAQKRTLEYFLEHPIPLQETDKIWGCIHRSVYIMHHFWVTNTFSVSKLSTSNCLFQSK